MSYTDWYFQKDNTVLFVNEDTQRVGILNENPTYTLDVDGTINTSNILAVNVVCDYIEGSNAIIDTIEGDNAMIDNINCVRLTATSNVIVGSNLAILNTFLNRPCPFPGEANYFGYNDQGWIHSSWIHTDPDLMDLLEKLWNIGAAGWDIFDAVADVYRYFNPGSDTISDALKDALTDALNDGTIRVDWDALNNKPIYASKLTKEVAFKGDVYLADAQTLYSLPSDKYTTIGQNGNMYLTSTTGREAILNVGSREMFLKNITTSNLTASNMTITSNLEVTKVNTNELIGGNVSVVSQLRVGEFYVRDDGIYRGDPSFPLTSQLIINSQGNYVGTIDRNQLVNLEAFQLSSLMDGNLIWGSFGNTTALNDPFQMSSAIFNV